MSATCQCMMCRYGALDTRGHVEQALVTAPRIAAEWGNWRPFDRRDGVCMVPGCFVCAGKLPERPCEL